MGGGRQKGLSPRCILDTTACMHSVSHTRHTHGTFPAAHPDPCPPLIPHLPRVSVPPPSPPPHTHTCMNVNLAPCSRDFISFDFFEGLGPMGGWRIYKKLDVFFKNKKVQVQATGDVFLALKPQPRVQRRGHPGSGPQCLFLELLRKTKALLKAPSNNFFLEKVLGCFPRFLFLCCSQRGLCLHGWDCVGCWGDHRRARGLPHPPFAPAA